MAKSQYSDDIQILMDNPEIMRVLYAVQRLSEYHSIESLYEMYGEPEIPVLIKDTL